MGHKLNKILTKVLGESRPPPRQIWSGFYRSPNPHTAYPDYFQNLVGLPFPNYVCVNIFMKIGSVVVLREIVNRQTYAE